jgi:MFS family permease
MPKNLKNQLLYIFGLSTSLIGSKLYGFAFSFYVLRITGSALSFSLSLILMTLPEVLFSPIAGVISDRYSKKTLVITMDILSALLFLALYIFYHFLGFSLEIFYLAIVLNSILSTFFVNAFSAAIPEIFEQEHLTSINANSSLVRSLLQIIGPVMSGFCLSFMSLEVIIAFNAVTFLISAISEYFIDFSIKENTHVQTSPTSDKPNFFRELKEGIHYIKSSSWIFILITNAAIINFCISVIFVVIPYVVVDYYKQSSEAFGIIEAAFALGTIFASLVATKYSKVDSLNNQLASGIFIIGASIMLVGIPEVLGIEWSYKLLILYSVINFMFGFVIMYLNIPLISAIQIYVSDDVRGRVFGLMQAVVVCIMPLGYFINGLVLEQFSLVAVTLSFGFLTILNSIVLKYRLSELMAFDNK